MKLYLFDTIERFNRLSRSLDAKTYLCNKTWNVFNDGGEKESYKFKEDGSMIIVLSGRISRGNWEYDPNDNTIEIYSANEAYMVHPSLLQDILVLNIDGTRDCAFLVDENDSEKYPFSTYSGLIEYFENEERKRIEEEKEAERLLEQQKKEIEEQERQAILQRNLELERERQWKIIYEEFINFLKENNYQKSRRLNVRLLCFIPIYFIWIIGGYYLFRYDMYLLQHFFNGYSTSPIMTVTILLVCGVMMYIAVIPFCYFVDRDYEKIAAFVGLDKSIIIREEGPNYQKLWKEFYESKESEMSVELNKRFVGIKKS